MSPVEDRRLIVTGPMSQGGDSGSVLIAGDTNKAVGLLFAGSNESTIHNPIQTVLDCLEIDLVHNAESKEPVIRRASAEEVQAVKEAHQEELLSKSNVVGVGVGLKQVGGKRTDDLALVVMVSEKLPEAQLAPEDIIPLVIDGVPVDIKEVGRLEAH